MSRNISHEAIDSLLQAAGIEAWGVAANSPRMTLTPPLPRMVSLLASFDPVAFAGMVEAPTEAYVTEYHRLNAVLDDATVGLCRYLEDRGFHTVAVAATIDDCVDWGAAGVFPHKTAATQAGLGWIGKTALFVSPVMGPRVRLATVFTDADLTPGTPVVRGRCGRCRKCVDACPVGAGRDIQWRAGMTRDLLYDYEACQQRLAGFSTLDEVCGVCVAACPFGRSHSPRDGRRGRTAADALRPNGHRR